MKHERKVCKVYYFHLVIAKDYMLIVIPRVLDSIFGADFIDNGSDSTAGGGGGCCNFKFICILTIPRFKILSLLSAI